MAAAVAEKIDFTNAFDAGLPVTVGTRSQALELMIAGQPAVHEQGVDARIYRAASGLIEGHRAGRKVDIEAYGYPFDVLENVAAQLQSIGASQYVTAQVMDSLQDYILNMGSDFSRAAKAKPLYARIMVTNKAPDDLPECEQTQATLIDGVRKIGGDAARIMVQNTVFGTKSTTSQGVDLDTMFASNNNGLFVFFGSPQNMGVGGFDSVDAALVNLAQGMAGGVGGAGGAMAQAVEQIKEAIKNGEATPQALKLIESLATLAQVTDAMKTPGAVSAAPAKIAEIVRDITAQIQTGVSEGVLPPAIVEGTVSVIAAMQTNEVLSAIIVTPGGAAALIADNDNAPVVPLENAAALVDSALVQQLTDTVAQASLASAAAADVAEIIAILQKADGLPPALAEIIAKIDIATVTPEQVAQAMDGKGELAVAVQAAMVSMSDPAVMAQVPSSVTAQVDAVMARQPEVMQVVVAQAVIKTVESAIKTAPADTAVVMEAAKIVRDLKEGTQTIRTLDAPKIAVMAAVVADAAPKNVSPAPAAAPRSFTPPVSAPPSTPATPTQSAPPISPRADTPRQDTPRPSTPAQPQPPRQQDTARPEQPRPVNPQPAQPQQSNNKTLPSAPPPQLPRETVKLIETVVKNPAIPPKVRDQINVAIKSGDPKKLVEAVRNNPELIRDLPPAEQGNFVRAIAAQLTPPAPPRGNNGPDAPPPIPPKVVATLDTIVNNPAIPPEIRIQLQEAINSGDPSRVKQIFETSPEIARVIPPEQRIQINDVVQKYERLFGGGGSDGPRDFQKPTEPGCGGCKGERGCCKAFAEADNRANTEATKAMAASYASKPLGFVTIAPK